jgi:signal transduction histidine kinase
MEHSGMRKLLSLCIALTALVGVAFTAAADNAHTPDDAKALVQKAAVFFKDQGKDKALAAFNDPKGEFVKGDLYLFVMDANDGKLTMLAHGVNKALLGKPQIDVKDAEGKAFNREMVGVLEKADETWMTYMWPNPATKKIASKKSYVVKIGGVVIGAGVYN